MTFDVEGARRAGYSDTEIAGHLAGARGFNLQGARQAGYSDTDIVAHLSRVVTPPDAGPQEAGTSTVPPPPVPRGMPSASRGVAQGLGDAFFGAQQLVANSLPQGVLDTVNSVRAGIASAPVIGPAARALGMDGSPYTPESVNQGVAQRETAYQAARAADGDTGFDVGRTVGNVATALPLAMALPAGGSMLGAAGFGALQGALGTAVQPVTNPNQPYWEQKGTDVATGGAVGAVAGPVGRAVGRAIAPNVAPDVALLRSEGVQMTPGQIAGGMTRRVENMATSLPFVGNTIIDAQTRTFESFNRAAANRVLRPLGQTVARDAPVGRELIEDVGQRVSAAYANVLPQIPPFVPDQAFVNQLAAIRKSIPTEAGRQTFGELVESTLTQRLAGSGGRINGDVYQVVKSDLGKLAREYGGSTGPAIERQVGGAINKLMKAWQETMSRAAPPAVRPALQRVDMAYANLLRLEGAAASVGAADGVFTPAQLQAAVRRLDETANHRGFARGNALMQDLSDAGRSVLPSNVPNSASAERAGLIGLATGALGVAPAAAVGASGLAAAYSPWGQRAINAVLAGQRGPGTQAVGNAIANSGALLALPFVPR